MLSEHAGAVQHPGPDEPGAAAVDGRSARRERGRAAAVRATVELFDEGELRPSAEAVCGRAGISTASLFRYFGGLDDLYRAAFEQQIARAAQLARVDHVPGAPLEDRVRRFVAGRLDVYEVTVGVGRMGRARAVDHPDVALALDRARAGWLDQVRDVFRTELVPMGRSRATSTAAAVDAVASFEAWELLAVARDIGRRSIDAHWRTAVTALLS